MKSSSGFSALEELLPDHRRQATELFTASFNVISSRRFPSFDLDKGEKALIVFGTDFTPEDVARMKRSGNYKKKVEEAASRRHVARELTDRLRKRKVDVDLEIEIGVPQELNFENRAQELIDLIEARPRPKLVIFVVNSAYQARQLAAILGRVSLIPDFELARRRVVVIVTAHPNLLWDFAWSTKKEVRDIASYVFAYTGSRSRAAEVLADVLSDLPEGSKPGEHEPPMMIPNLNQSPDWEVRPCKN